ncbi:MAG TPA: histidine kinase [Candidatus Dormibacteraeota bacterium]|nr:histidine kinase [Candidatus Dormibacteraeota bacterium]
MSRPRLFDGLVVAFNVLLGLLGLAGSYYRSGSLSAVSLFVVLVQALPLWWRRSHPVTVLLVIVATEVVKRGFGLSSDPSGASLAFAAYAVSTYDRSAARVWVAGAAIAIIVAAVALLVLGFVPLSRDLIPVGAVTLVAWVIGDYVRGRRAFFAGIIARHSRESEATRARAVEEERLRIARELHDVVAHNVSVMAIQAGAARVSGEGTKEALLSIESTARDTLAELNRLLGVLRKDPAAPARSPQPGLDQVEGLLDTARESGVDASLKVTGETRTLPAALDLSAYRIVQEAITNVLKHANASRLEVTIGYEPDALVLAISDNGGGAARTTEPSNGHGLIGMRERVELFGGEMGTGSSSLGGFTVHARLPIK